jgi:hypothetical protein
MHGKKEEEKGSKIEVVKNRVRASQKSQYEYSRIKIAGDEEAITVWDLPQHASRTQIFNAVRHLGRIRNIEIIGGGRGKSRAEVRFEESRSIENKKEIWVVPFLNECLVRITQGLSRRELLENRKEFVLKLYGIPRDTNKILLFRQLKHTGAKAVHVFKNTNGNNKGYAVVSFSNKYELERAGKCYVTYYNYKLQWEEQRENTRNPVRYNESIVKIES